MNVATRFKELRKMVRHESLDGKGFDEGSISQAAAMLVLADVLQGTTHSVDLSFDERYPVRVQAEVEQR